MRRTTSITYAFSFLLLTGGCTLAPRYRRPAMPVPQDWVAEARQTASPELKTFFRDERLVRTIEMVQAENRDLRLAALQVEKMAALLRIQRSNVFPSVGVMGSGQKTRIPGSLNSYGEASTKEQYSVQFGTMSWEIDLFGRLRSLKNQALNEFLATQEARRAVEISLVATTAQAWMNLAHIREQLELAQETLKVQTRTLAMMEQSHQVGMSSQLDLAQARTQVEAARGDLARLQGLEAQARHGLDLLAGGAVPEDCLPQDWSGVEPLEDLKPGLSSDVLLCRPDIRMAEYHLQAANAYIGAARAAFFPRISLTAGVGTMSPDLSGLFASGNKTWSFTPSVISPLFASGSLVAGLKASHVQKKMAVAEYEKSIQAAFREFRDVVALTPLLLTQRSAQEGLVQEQEKVLRLNEARYREGLSGYLPVLLAQKTLYAARQGLSALRLAQEQNRIALFKALGGGI